SHHEITVGFPSRREVNYTGRRLIMTSLTRRKHLLAAMLLRTILLFALSDFFFCSAHAAELDPSPLTLTFCCSETNDLYLALLKGGTQYPRFDQAADAFEHAQPSSAVLILADHYPNEP